MKRIALMTAFAGSIVVFWLMPNINKATATSYTRRYEDTDRRLDDEDTLKRKKKPAPNAAKKPVVEKKDKSSDKVAPKKTAESSPKKIYKSESIKSTKKLSSVTPKMFSRAIHFVPDSVEEVPVATLKEDGSDGLAGVDSLLVRAGFKLK